MNPNTLTPLLVIGIMTGNSMDAVDTVLTAFFPNGTIVDLAFHSEPYPSALFHNLKQLRTAIIEAKGDMATIAEQYQCQHDGAIQSFDTILNEYMILVLKGVNALIAEAKRDTALADYDLDKIDLIGFHGQTCAHQPPGMGDLINSYTIQIGDGQWLADQTGITTVYDFRSDDLMAGGEAAPLIPTHHRHLARALKRQKALPITFINAGNTSNLSHLTFDKNKKLRTLGWDAGPFNHLPDLLMRQEKQLPCDIDGQHGKKGKVNLELLDELFEHAATTAQQKNYLSQPPPKSSDPAWYSADCLLSSKLAFVNKLRTAEYFSAYLTYHSLGFTPESVQLPSRFAIFGGGWKNKIIFKHFKGLLAGDFERQPVLAQHLEHFKNIQQRLKTSGPVSLEFSDHYGFAADAMEARLFADMARCRILAVPYTQPSITGCTTPQICGVIAYPNRDQRRASETLQTWQGFGNPALLTQTNKPIETRWSRAAAGWQKAQAAMQRA